MASLGAKRQIVLENIWLVSNDRVSTIAQHVFFSLSLSLSFCLPLYLVVSRSRHLSKPKKIFILPEFMKSEVTPVAKMSPLMIILLILILLICSSHSNDLKNRDIEKVKKINGNFSALQELPNYSGVNFINYNDIATMKSEKLRYKLQRLMSTMVKKIIQQRRLERMKKMELGENEVNYVKMAAKRKIPLGKFPVGNDLEADEQDGRNEMSHDGVIGGTGDGNRETVSRKLEGISKSRMPLKSTDVRSKMRKVGADFENYEYRISHNEINSRVKRESVPNVWIKRDFEDHQTNLRMHALIVKDEDIPPCCSPAKEVSNRRYFMCSGAVLTLKHAITTASCMHFADIYEHEIQADLAVLIGATTPRAYVIKINRYEMHPDYNYDVDSPDNALHNVALIYLSCSIVAQDAIIPKLPKGMNDDVAHMCCREDCDLITVVQGADNRHVARIIKAKNLPAPRHNDEDPHDGEVPHHGEFPFSPIVKHRSLSKGIVTNESLAMTRRIRSPLRLAAAPIFFGKETRARTSNRNSEKRVESTVTKKRTKTKTVEPPSVKNQRRNEKKIETMNLADFMSSGKSSDAQIPILRALEEEGVNVEEQLAAVDWEEIEQTMSKKFSDENRETMEIFVKNVVDETMKRLGNVLGDDATNSTSGLGGGKGDAGVTKGDGTIFGKLMANDKKNRTIASFVRVFTKVVGTLVPPNNGAGIIVSSDSSVEEKDLEDPSPIYEKCPPLGSPVISDGTLVGLLAYTCDDVQSWVEWKYVNIAKNMIWITRQISAPYEPTGICTETGRTPTQPRSATFNSFNNTSYDRNSWKKDHTNSHDSRVEWRRRHVNEEKINDSLRNFEDARISMTEASPRIHKDSWYARNLQPAPRELSNEPTFQNFPERSKISIVRKRPAYNVNTCYVRADGTIDCQQGIEFEVR